MGSPLRRLKPLAPALLAFVAGLPLAWALWAVASQAANAQAWQALWSDPQTLQAWAMTLWTGLASTGLVWLTVSRLLASGFIRKQLARWLAHVPALLAMPHAAMAIGLVLWLSPSGWLLRLVSPDLTGFEAPPPWFTTQDPWGLGLILALWLKEVPFLVWVAATQMQREDVRRRWQAEHALAQTLGRTPAQAFAQVVWPQLAKRLRWPTLAVLAYSLTVVDMAIIIGPASPPTLAVLTWQWLSDADVAMQAQGVAAAGLLTLTVAFFALLQGVAVRLGGKTVSAVWRRFASRGSLPQTPKAQDHLTVVGGSSCGRMDGQDQSVVGGSSCGRVNGQDQSVVGGSPCGRMNWGWGLILAIYFAVAWALAVGSVSGVWVFPQLWPSVWTQGAWLRVLQSADTLWTTLGLALASASVCLAWSVAWLEVSTPRWQKALRPWLLLPLVLPSVLWVVGLYSIALQWRLEGQWLGLLLAHSVMVLPYVLLALEPAYQSVDPRQRAVVASLGHGRWAYLRHIQWPLLKRALASAWAVGFAVSVAQYLPTLYVGAGRFATVTTEAVTLASGGQRSLMSAYAILQMGLPLLAFALAAWLGRPRQFDNTNTPKETP